MSFRGNKKIICRAFKEYKPSHLDENLCNLVLAIEDRRFWDHCGVDFIAVARAARDLAFGRARGGASTIDMQLVRTLTLQRDRTLQRKVAEMALAVWMRRQFGSSRVLDLYLQIAYLGSGLSGMEEAANSIFGKGLSTCSFRQKAMLSAMLLSPAPSFRSLTWWARVMHRASFAQRKCGAGIPDEQPKTNI